MGLGFGIVGTGMISRFHVKAIADIEGAEFVACCTGLPGYVEGAEKLVEGTDATAHASLEEMLADPKVDVVTICTPSGVHMEPAVAAANAGKHVIVEKPLEITLDRCDKIIEACEKNKVVCSAIFPSRFHKASLTLKHAVDSGKFGRLTLGDAYVKWFRTQEYYDSGEWRGTWALDGGGALMNQAIRNAGSRKNRSRRRRDRGAEIQERCPGRDRSNHGGVPGNVEEDRDPREHWFGRDRRGRYQVLGV